MVQLRLVAGILGWECVGCLGGAAEKRAGKKITKFGEGKAALFGAVGAGGG
jgi:hypothetical protein